MMATITIFDGIIFVVIILCFALGPGIIFGVIPHLIWKRKNRKGK